MHAELSSGARIFCLNFHLHPYFVNASSEPVTRQNHCITSVGALTQILSHLSAVKIIQILNTLQTLYNTPR